jgi:hypothetical protein
MTMTKETTMPMPVTFTPEELMLLHRAARAVWTFAAPATLDALATERGTTVDGVSLSRREVVDVVLATGRLDPAVRRLAPPPTLIAKLAVCDDEMLLTVVRGAFPRTRYGR